MTIDLRSDTLTVPTQEMREAMFKAAVGDDVWGEDPTVIELEALAADVVGKEASLFVPSGTMGNQVAAMTHMPARGMEVIVEADSHMFFYEVGGLAVLSGAQVRALEGRKGKLEPAAVTKAIREKNIHMPRTGLLCLENTHNRASGTVMTAEETAALASAAHEQGVPVHLDGARIFNAATALGTDAASLAKDVDSVMFCLSKGLGAPVGSMLAGSADFIERARRNRKLLGGGMRQAGILAAAGIVALKKMVGRLAQDHILAKEIAQNLATIPGISLDMSAVQTNIVVFDVSKTGLTSTAFVERLAGAGVLASSFGPSLVRFVTHKDVPAGAGTLVADAVSRVVAAKA